MPSQISDIQVGQAILQSVQRGSYVGSEEIVASNLPPSALATVIQLVEHARDDVKVGQKSAGALTVWLTDLGLENHPGIKQRECS